MYYPFSGELYSKSNGKRAADLFEVSLPEVSGDEFAAVGRVELQERLHLHERLVLRDLVAVEEVDQHLQDVVQRAEVAGWLLALKWKCFHISRAVTVIIGTVG